MKIDHDITNQVVLSRSMTRSARCSSMVRPIPPALVAGDWLTSPSGVEGYIAGRSLETPGAWIFMVKTGDTSWDFATVEMMPDGFIGFKHMEML